MTSITEQEDEARTNRLALQTHRVANGGLESAIGRTGGVLTGFSAKMSGEDVLLTLRITMPSGKMIAWVGGETLGSALRKAFREGNRDGLNLREDKWD